MAATKTADKPAKQSAKAAPGKIFDIAHPGKSVPSATARPVIVSNRPLLQDPMVASAAEEPEHLFAAKPSGKLTIKPLEDNQSDQDDQDSKDSDEPKLDLKIETKKDSKDNAEEDTSKLPSAPKIELNLDVALQPKSKSKKAEKEAEPSDKSDGHSDAETEASDEEAAKPADDKAAEAEPAKSTGKQSGTDIAVNADKVQPEAPAADEKETDDAALAGTPPEDGTNGESTKDQKELAELEAKAKLEEEITKLVESRQYFLPINAVERHRSKMISLLGLLLIIILGLVLVDIMMDSGTLHIPGVQPVTHFFSA